MSIPSAAGAPPLSASDDRLWGSLAHIGNIIGFLPALLILLILKDRGPVVNREARSALNWVITVTIAYVVVVIVGAVLSFIGHALPNGTGALFLVLAFLVGLLNWVLGIANIVFSIVNGVRVNRGGVSRYPYSLNLVR